MLSRVPALVVEAVPMKEWKDLIIAQIQEAKALSLQIIKERTGEEPAPDYMITHAHEFEWPSVTNAQGTEITWVWKGEPLVRQVSVLKVVKGHLEGSFRTVRYEPLTPTAT